MSSAPGPRPGQLRQSQVTVDSQQALQTIGRALKTRRGLTFSGLWIFGLCAMFLLPAPVPLTEASLAGFEAKLTEVCTVHQCSSTFQSLHSEV